MSFLSSKEPEVVIPGRHQRFHTPIDLDRENYQGLASAAGALQLFGHGEQQPSTALGLGLSLRQRPKKRGAVSAGKKSKKCAPKKKAKKPTKVGGKKKKKRAGGKGKPPRRQKTILD
uniref:Uncharacterized protein n=1 Tax=Plectus sambesii TaxID=2011161 RepID=A0A914WT66_9BILA